MQNDPLNKLLNKEFEFTDNNGNKIEIPVSGNLGLLAVGYKGLVAVRKERNKLKNNKK